jgi:CRP-like cAMP-binding protein
MDGSVGELDLDVGLLQRVPMFHPLPLPAIEQLARGLEPVTVPAGQDVITQGDVGDHYYVIVSGEADIVGDGRVVASLGPGEGFGEIALLRRSRRTATVHARSTLQLRALSSERFIAVVTGFTASAWAAEQGVQDRLDRFEPGDSRREPPTAT